MHISSKGGNSATVTASWDEHDLDGVGTTNDLYDEALYSSFSKTTKLSLRRVDHEKINYELVLDLLKLIDSGLCSGRLNRRQPLEGGGGGGGGEREGAVLVFLPGLGEIMQLHDMLMASSVYSNRNKWMIVAAHSSLSAEEQRRIFKRPPPGVRKVVLATNIAETSITIDDVVFVIDTGRVKQSRYHQSHKIRTLVECWVDKASARQRAGRAGRVCAGHCFHLYTRVLATQVFEEHSSPEMRRVPLEELCLQILAMGHIDVMSFLAKALDAPSPSAVSAALSTLSDVSAIDERGRLTALGQHLAKLPVDPHIGKLLVLGAIFECIDPILTIAACCSYKSPLASSIDRRADMAEARKRLGGPSPESDLLLSVNAYNQWAAACHEGGGRGGETVCRDHCLNAAVLVQLRDLRRQFADLLKNIGFLPRRGEGNRSRNSRPLANGSLFDQESNANGGSTAVVCGVVCAGLYPNIVKVEQWRGNDMVLRGQAAEGRDLILHKSSALYNRNDAVPPGALIVYHQKMATSRSYVMDATLVHANAVVLFGGKLVVDHVNAGVTLDGWLHLHVPARTAVMIKELRNELDALLRNKVQHPQMDLKKEGGGLVKAVLLLLQENAPKNN
jgi:HrpA-like RNA helicase